MKCFDEPGVLICVCSWAVSPLTGGHCVGVTCSPGVGPSARSASTDALLHIELEKPGVCTQGMAVGMGHCPCFGMHTCAGQV